MNNNISIEQLEWMRDQRYIWLSDPKNYGNVYYNKVRDEYVQFCNMIAEYDKSAKERRTKIIAACVSGGIGLLGIVTATMISNSSLGAKFDNSMKGISGKITGNNF